MGHMSEIIDCSFERFIGQLSKVIVYSCSLEHSLMLRYLIFFAF